MTNETLFRNGIISQSGECIIRLSRYLLTMEKGDRIAPKSELATQYGLSAGTVQTGFKSLENLGAVKILSRGHLGSYVEEIDKARLWEYSMYGYIRGTMPIPYHNLLIGLATGINNCFDSGEGIMLKMSYVRGGRTRIENVIAGPDDFAVCSVFAAECAAKEGCDVHIFRQFGSGTYMGNSVVLLRKGAGLSDGIRVGVDPSSLDQQMLSRKMFEGYDVDFIDVHYNNYAFMLNSGQIDACIWSSDDLDEFEGEIASLPPEMAEMIDKAGRAAIVVSGESLGKMNCVGKLFDVEKIERMQKLVMEHKEIPNY